MSFFMDMNLLYAKIQIIDHIKTGESCRREREKLGVSVKTIADLMRLSPAYVGDLEKGRRNWREDLVKQYNDALEGRPT